MEITNLNQLDFSKPYTVKEYLSWTFDEKVELFKGYLAKMSPAPNSNHQIISQNLNRYFLNYFYKQPCKVFAAPFDVYLPMVTGNGDTIVQPDICVVCDTAKIEKQGCVGSPDLIVEILSPGNSSKEIKNKYDIYQEAKVKEYWIIYPSECVVQIYKLVNEEYFAEKPLTKGDMATSHLFNGLQIDLNEVFENLLDI